MKAALVMEQTRVRLRAVVTALRQEVGDRRNFGDLPGRILRVQIERFRPRNMKDMIGHEKSAWAADGHRQCQKR